MYQAKSIKSMKHNKQHQHYSDENFIACSTSFNIKHSFKCRKYQSKTKWFNANSLAVRNIGAVWINVKSKTVKDSSRKESTCW